MTCRIRKYVVLTLSELIKKSTQIEDAGSKAGMQAENYIGLLSESRSATVHWSE